MTDQVGGASETKIEVEFFINMVKTIQGLDEAANHADRLKKLLDTLKTEGADFPTKELESLKRGFGDTNLSTEVLIMNIARAREEILAYAAESKRSLDAVFVGFKLANEESKKFSALEISAAIQQIERDADRLKNQLTLAFSSPLKNAQAFLNDVERIKQEVRRLQQVSSMALEDIEVGFRRSEQTSKEFRPEDLTRAFRDLREEAKQAELAIQRAFVTPEREATAFRKNVNALKTEMTLLRNTTNLTAKDIEVGFRRAEKTLANFSPDEISQAMRELKAEAIEAEKILAKLTANPRREGELYRRNIEEIKRKVEILRQTSNLTLREIEVGFRRANAASKDFRPDEITDAFKDLKDATDDQTDSTGGLGTVASFVFGSVLGVTAISVLRDLVRLMQDASEQAIEFSNALFGIEIAARGLQRIGLDVTIQDLNDIVEEIQEIFPIFSEQEITEVVGQVALFTRNFGFNFEQIQDTIRATAIIAELEGTTITEAFDRIRTALGSGRFQGIRNLRAGLNIDETTLAVEAQRLEWDKHVDSLTRAERATLTLIVLQKQLAAVEEDAGAITETLVGEQLAYNAAVDNTKKTLGTLVQFFITPFRGIATLVLPILEELLIGFTKFVVSLFAVGVAFISTMITRIVTDWQRVIKFFETGELEEGIDLLDQFTNAYKSFRDAVNEDIFGETLGDLPEDQFGSIDAFQDYAEGLEEESENVLDKVAKIFANFNSKIQDLAIDLGRKLQDLELKRIFKIEDETRKSLLDREKINRQFNARIADAEAKFREKELKAEEDFQEKLRSLRDKFLFDLEDALRERDARQVLRLIQRFNLQNKEAIQQEAQDEQQRRRAFQGELQQIEEQRQRRLFEQQLEFEERLRNIDIQHNRERLAAIKNHARRVQDLIRQRDERLAILREELDTELRMILDQALAKLQLLARIQAIQRTLFREGIGDVGESTRRGPERPRGSTTTTTVTPFAEGGTLVANRPTLALFGEVPEVVSFSPINRIGANEGKVFGGSLPSGMGRKDRIDLMVSLSPGLEASVIDKTMGRIANIIVEQV